MNKHFQSKILAFTKAKGLKELEIIQSLWSGYGQIIRYELEEGITERVIVKHIQIPQNESHPRGWNTNLSHQRKLHSYQVESYWYEHWNKITSQACRVPKCYGIERGEEEILIVLEDLDHSGFPFRKGQVNWSEIESCLNWLACFHAIHLLAEPKGLWEIGTYWHLDTRPDELAVLEDLELKQMAGAIDEKLNHAQFKTLVHGDAKLANFCFSKDGSVAGVDFQYVGGGCGMKDVAYFIGSCLDESSSEELESKILSTYFTFLKQALIDQKKNIDFEALKTEWTELFPIAWADFHRFLKGWSPGHWKINSYSEKVTQKVIREIKREIL